MVVVVVVVVVVAELVDGCDMGTKLGPAVYRYQVREGTLSSGQVSSKLHAPAHSPLSRSLVSVCGLLISW